MEGKPKEAEAAARLPATLWDLSAPGRAGVRLPAADVPEAPPLPPGLLRGSLDLPEVSELGVVRYFTRLSQQNFSVDTSFYPLGSCTMKYNPRADERAATLPGFASLHPLQPEESVQGALELMYRLQEWLAAVTGMAGCSLATLAGAHGELSGVLMLRAYHLARGDTERTVMLVPDTAHGTNPATAAMAGFRVQAVPSDRRGNMDLAALRRLADGRLAGVMVTLPSTLGLFDTGIVEICETVHQAGGLVYGDGANMNALLGRALLGSLGFDVVHLNLHKTFATPHGGGGPGAGPVCAANTLSPYLPSPVVERRPGDPDGGYTLAVPPRSIGKVAAFHGNFGVLVRAYAYIRALGAQGLKQVSGDAVLNANYLLARLRGLYAVPYDRPCMHEVVLSASAQKRRGVSALDLAKRMIDYGVHPPTMYFPLIVQEALMVEPTEAEGKETLDAFVGVMEAIAREVEESPETVHSAPHHTPVGRLDEVLAARRPELRWRPPV